MTEKVYVLSFLFAIQFHFRKALVYLPGIREPQHRTRWKFECIMNVILCSQPMQPMHKLLLHVESSLASILENISA